MLTRYEPWGAMRQLRDEMNRAFGESRAMSDGDNNLVAGDWMPAVDIQEQDNRYLISADIPGVDPADIELTMDNGTLTLKGERKSESEEEGENGYRRVERSYGSFLRRFSLPETADADNISAQGKNGVLEVVIPKAAAVQPKRIEVAS